MRILDLGYLPDSMAPLPPPDMDGANFLPGAVNKVELFWERTGMSGEVGEVGETNPMAFQPA